jgi:hypothetical protein
MPVRKTAIRSREAQTVGQNPYRKFKHPGKDGGAERTKANNAIAEPGIHFLKGIGSISSFETAIHLNKTDELLSFFDTEEKQLKAIKDLYSIVKAQPCYKNMKEPDWIIDDEPLKILVWVLRKLGRLAEGDNWSIDVEGRSRNSKYVFVIHRAFNRNIFREREEYFPLDFLPGLKNRDEPLHDLIISVIALTSARNSIPLWDEDGDFSVALASFDTSTTSDNSYYLRQRQSYKFGDASEYLQLVKEKRNVITERDIINQLANYNCNSQRKQSIVWWIKNGLRLAATGKNIQPFNYIPSYHTKPVITPDRQYKYVWSLHNHDVLKVKAFHSMNIQAKEGDYYPIMFSITRPGEVLNKIHVGDFPVQLFDFLDYGIKLFMYRHREYFYKQQFDDQMTPSEALLAKIEANEIKSLK